MPNPARRDGPGTLGASLKGRERLRLELEYNDKIGAMLREGVKEARGLARANPLENQPEPRALGPGEDRAVDVDVQPERLPRHDLVELAVNGQAVAVPARAWTTDAALDVSTVRPANELVFTCEGDAAGGYRVCAASIILDAPAR